MYEPLPPELAVRSGAVEHDEETGQGQKQMLLKQIVDELAGALSSNVYESKVENKVLNLGGGGDSARRAWKRSSKEVKPLKGSRRANAGCHKRDVRRMVVGDGKYGGLLPLNDLWHDHVNAVANRKVRAKNPFA